MHLGFCQYYQKKIALNIPFFDAQRYVNASFKFLINEVTSKQRISPFPGFSDLCIQARHTRGCFLTRFLTICADEIPPPSVKQVSQYVTEGLERAIEALKEAAALRERFGYNTNTNRKVASAVAIAVRYCPSSPPFSASRNFSMEPQLPLT